MPLNNNVGGDESLRLLIMTVNMLTKKVDELEERIRVLERNKR